MFSAYRSCGLYFLPVLIGLVQFGGGSIPPPPLQCQPECSLTAVCVWSPDGTYKSCQCIPGKTGENCTFDDPCMEQTDDCPEGSRCYGPCDPNFYCEGATGEPHCIACAPGWQGMSCDIDINECITFGDLACYNGGQCVNTVGDYGCVCKDDWIGKQCRCKEGKPCEDDIITNETFVYPPKQDDVIKKTEVEVVNVPRPRSILLTTVTRQATQYGIETTPGNGQSKLSAATSNAILTLVYLSTLFSNIYR